MLFALICTDKPGALTVRMAARSAHVDYLKSLGEKVKQAGPFLDDAGEMSGSLVIVDVSDRAGAEAIAANDPYAHAGLFRSVEIRSWKWTFKNPEAA